MRDRYEEGFELLGLDGDDVDYDADDHYLTKREPDEPIDWEEFF